jgi:ribosomal-protein-alanine N-acetyltransferase
MAVLETPRLRLAPFGPDEAGLLHQLWMDPGVRRYLWDDQVIPPEQTAETIEKSEELFRRHGYGLWSLRWRETGELIGFAGYWHFRDPPELELLFGLAPGVWGRGLAAEASRELLRHAFEDLGFTEVRASTDAENRASLRVLEKLGMPCKRRATVQGLDTVFYSLQEEEWRHSLR